MTTDVVRELVALWQADSRARRQRAPHDPAAEVLDACAAELQEKFAASAVEPLSPDEWGAIHGGVSPQTVTAWLRNGELEGYRDDRGRWRIPPSSRRQRSA